MFLRSRVRVVNFFLVCIFVTSILFFSEIIYESIQKIIVSFSRKYYLFVPIEGKMKEFTTLINTVKRKFDNFFKLKKFHTLGMIRFPLGYQ